LGILLLIPLTAHWERLQSARHNPPQIPHKWQGEEATIDFAIISPKARKS